MTNNIFRYVVQITAFFFIACASADSGLESANSVTVDQKFKSKKAPVDLSFIVIGDSGYVSNKSGESSLVKVSAAAKQYCADHGCDFGLMAGDNIYPKGADGNPNGVEDAKRFQTVFLKPYGDFQQYTNTDFRLYAALGNHDWYNSRAGALAQIAFLRSTPPFFMGDFFYRVKPKAGQGEVELFVIDTEMLLATLELERVKINRYGKPASLNRKSGGGTPNALPASLREEQQLAWLDAALKSSNAKWKLVLGHHPLWESKGTKFKQAEALRVMLLPILCGQADAYFAGHQHTLEVHEDSCAEQNPESGSLIHVVSGAASKARSLNQKFKRWQSENHSQLTNHWAQGNAAGFVYISLDGDALDLRVLSVNKRGSVSEKYRRRF